MYLKICLLAILSVSCTQVNPEERRSSSPDPASKEEGKDKSTKDTELPSGEEKNADSKPAELKITNIAYEGNGCEDGSLAVDMAEDGKALTMTFDNFIAEIDGSGIERTHCQVSLDLENIEGWSYTTLGAYVRGYASLDEGVHAMQSISIGGKEMMVDYEMEFDGEFDDSFEHTKDVKTTELTWSPCDGSDRGPLKIGIDVVINNTSESGGGIIQIDSFDGNISQELGVKWRRCGS
jgi:hypothetical protein